MTIAAEQASTDRSAQVRALEAEAQRLGEAHRELRRASAGARFAESPRMGRVVERARKRLAWNVSDDPAVRRAAEWFLDNHYLVRRVTRQIAEELPRGFVQHLPFLADGPARGLPRIQVVARAFVAHTGADFDLAELLRFIDAYQKVSALTIAELWAFPTVLRLAVLQGLLRSLEALGITGRFGDDRIGPDSLPSPGSVTDPAPSGASGGLRSAGRGRSRARSARGAAEPPGEERAIRALRLLAEIDWKAFFEKTNCVEAILQQDPAEVYARMDFATCDAYRKAVEALAWSTGLTETDVAAHAVALARERVIDARLGHVGYYLVDEGRGRLEERLGYRPRGLERARRSLTVRPTALYLSAVGLVTAVPVLLITAWLAAEGARALVIVAAAALVVLPASVVAVTFVQWALAHLLAPRALPKLDFTRGLPDDVRTLVVIPTLLGREDDVERMSRQLERHYLANPDPQLSFALLTDDEDSPTMPESAALLEVARHAIEDLNAKHGDGRAGPFHLLHRSPGWNPGERCFMGWERKRGKLEELNRLLRGHRATSFSLHVGDPSGLEHIRYVITLDSDTQLPIEGAHRLIGLLAHPLNRAVRDPTTERVTAGYTVVQPRVETSPSSAHASRLSRIFAGDVGFDIYTHASSNTYQDLFGTGIYVGKGIYEVDSFVQSLAGRVPENALVSHDLFEGVHGRAALATDIVLFEESPSHYAAWARRMHRWVRGDWQLVPWLLPRVPGARGERLPNRLQAIDRWKIIDNLRRSLAGPSIVALLLSGWTWLPGSALVWTLLALSALAAPVVPSLVENRSQRANTLSRLGMALVFLVHESAVVVDAIVRVTFRLSITRRRLLQWKSAARTAQGLGRGSPRTVLWREMWASPSSSAAIAGLLAWARPTALLVAVPLLAAWCLAPELARWLSRPAPPIEAPLQEQDRRILRRLARRTWLFFETFVGPGDQWLPVDNHQEYPAEQTAQRTSPTNIGMMLLSTLAAHDLGYIGPSELALRVRRAFETIARLQHYQGHLLNWYETRNLQPLLPRYVSTVDSGNFAGCLLALAQGCREVTRAPVLRAASWLGLADSLDLLEEALDETSVSGSSLGDVIARIRRALEQAPAHPREARQTLDALRVDGAAELERELLAMVETSAFQHQTEVLEALRTWIARFRQQLEKLGHELDRLCPWLAWANEPAAAALEQPGLARLGDVPEIARRLQAALDRSQSGGGSAEIVASAARLRAALALAAGSATKLQADLLEMAALAESEARGMDFKLLFDPQRKLFHIGYDVTLDRVDTHHYDLLASEARLASYLAIVARQVPESHWSALGRPMTHVRGGPALLSWGGTMFEYLMPSLLMRSHPGTLLEQSCAFAVDAQIAHGDKHEAPWGVSESAYARVDVHQTYQYRSFGVPGLGLKRGLEEDRVIAPYASVLAASLRPRAVVENVKRLTAVGMMGPYGMYEALDLDAERAPDGQSSTVVRSYMAHHQGMVLVALDNCLNAEIMVERFHADPSVEAGEILLDERAVASAPEERPTAEGPERPVTSITRSFRVPAAWSPRATGRPQAFVLSNGRLSSVVTDGGGGGLSWQGLALTSYQPDPTVDEEGLWIFLRDEDSGRTWRATSEEGRTTFEAHRAELHHRDQGISAHVDITIAPADDVEIRKVTLHNETNRPRRLTLTSAAEPVLAAASAAGRHPAFARLFVEVEHVPGLDALLFGRRTRSVEEQRAVLVHRLVCEGPAVTYRGGETDRSAFFGRCGSPRAPRSIAGDRRTALRRVGAPLDPIMSVQAAVELEPKGTVALAFVTTVGRTRGAALDLARRYGTMHAVTWAFRDAGQQSARRLHRAGLDPEVLPHVQRLFSALLVPDPALRAPVETLAAARPARDQLWGRGISGDEPIVVVSVADPEAPLVREVITAQRYLRSCGVPLDLVFLDEQASGYQSEGAGTLRATIALHQADTWMDRRGGVFVLPADRLSAEERRNLQASARAVFDTRDGSLARRMERAVIAAPPWLPRFVPSRQEVDLPGAPHRPPLQFDNGKGGFTEDGRAYVISLGPGQTTPAPWSNVLANPELGCLTTESSLGCTWSINAAENRLTPWRNDPVFDTPSEALYLRDEETAAIWSPTPLPAGRDAATLVTHGAGYTTYSRTSDGLTQELTAFVPPDTPFKVVRLRLRNDLPRHRRLTATYYAEWVLGSQRHEQLPHVLPELVRASACLLARCGWSPEFGQRVAFLAASRELHGFTTDRTEFLGRRGDRARPEALERWGLSGRVDAGLDPCAALQVHLELAPGERVETHFLLGQAPDRETALETVARHRDPAAIDRAWDRLERFWDDRLGRVRVETPEPAMDLLVNRWLLQQTLSARLWGRSGFYQSSGAFGFRDQLQDVLALLHAAPEVARAHVLEAAAHQFEEGDVLHWWHPPSNRGVRTRCSDDLVWLPFVTAEYVLGTGDTSVLAERVPYLRGEPLRPDEHDRFALFEPGGAPGTLLEHCRRALERGSTTGPHGLPLMGDGDWNDGMNRVGAKGRGESVWLAFFLCATMERFAAVCDRLSEGAEAVQWRARAKASRASVEASAWDGAWYLRAFHDDGSRLGSSSEPECSIDSIAQSWSVLSGADQTRARIALRSADERLVSDEERLILLLSPPFQSTPHDPGYIKAYPPGIRENGGQYTHAATWLGFAHAALGDGENATRIFRLLNPVLRTRTAADAERYRVEPYVLAGDVYGAAPWIGRGGWTWYTGAAAWAWRLGVEAILGLRMEDGHLRVDPCIPPTWKGFQAWIRTGEGQELHVVVDNPEGVSRGVAVATLDGARVGDGAIRLAGAPPGTRELHVRLGQRPTTHQDVDAAAELHVNLREVR